MMKAEKTIATYKRLRAEPLWQLLASDNGPIIIGLLQHHLYEEERTLPASILHDRIGRDLETLRANGENLPQSAKNYIATWLQQGYLERRFPKDSSEEVYELSAATVDTIRFVAGLAAPHSAATESRLALVIDALVDLASDSDSNKFRRIDRLIEERDKIDKQIAAIDKGQMRILSQSSATERLREILVLAEGLAGDFRKVREQFETLNRSLRERVMDSEANRGEVLNSLFAGIDLISESEAGRTFLAFWRLLTDPEQSSSLEQALENVLSRPFVAELSLKEKRFLHRFMKILLEQGGLVHEILQNFAKSLKQFVQSKEYLEQRRLNQLLMSATNAALELRNEVRAIETLQYTLELTSTKIRSISQWVMHNPECQAVASPMVAGDALMLDLDYISQCINQSEINFRELKDNIAAALKLEGSASIATVLEKFPATQGLGSVIGLVSLGSKHGMQSDEIETIAWQGGDGEWRQANIPKIYFLREKAHELR